MSVEEIRFFELQADICQTLANPKRLQILNLLKNGELSVGAMVAALEIAKPDLSQHLAVMRQKGILATRREGTTIYYRLATPHIVEACRVMRQVLLEALAERGADCFGRRRRRRGGGRRAGRGLCGEIRLWQEFFL